MVVKNKMSLTKIVNGFLIGASLTYGSLANAQKRDAKLDYKNGYFLEQMVENTPTYELKKWGKKKSTAYKLRSVYEYFKEDPSRFKDYNCFELINIFKVAAQTFHSNQKNLPLANERAVSAAYMWLQKDYVVSDQQYFSAMRGFFGARNGYITNMRNAGKYSFEVCNLIKNGRSVDFLKYYANEKLFRGDMKGVMCSSAIIVRATKPLSDFAKRHPDKTCYIDTYESSLLVHKSLVKLNDSFKLLPEIKLNFSQKNTAELKKNLIAAMVFEGCEYSANELYADPSNLEKFNLLLGSLSKYQKSVKGYEYDKDFIDLFSGEALLNTPDLFLKAKDFFGLEYISRKKEIQRIMKSVELRRKKRASAKSNLD